MVRDEKELNLVVEPPIFINLWWDLSYMKRFDTTL